MFVVCWCCVRVRVRVVIIGARRVVILMSIDVSEAFEELVFKIHFIILPFLNVCILHACMRALLAQAPLHAFVQLWRRPLASYAGWRTVLREFNQIK
jgi:hypothetical protein